MKYCQGCKYGYVIYPEWCETYDDMCNCTFESGCMYGLESDPPTDDEWKQFESEVKNHNARTFTNDH